MAKLKLKFRDISWMSKKYPYTRHLPRTQLVSDKEFEMEVVTASVSNAVEHVVTWETAFTNVPSVTATIALAGDDNVDQANVNVWIKAVTTINCTLNFSDNFTGTVNVQALRFT